MLPNYFNRKKIIPHIFFFHVILFSLYLTSCNKDNTFNKNDFLGDELISFEIEGIKETSIINQEKFTSDLKNFKSAKKENNSLLQKVTQTLTTYSNDDINAISSIYRSNLRTDDANYNIVDTTKAKNSKLQEKLNPKIASTKMTVGKKYRILIFDGNSNFITKLDATVGGAVPRWQNAKRNTTYKWIAYTFNSNNLPNFPDEPSSNDFQLPLVASSSSNLDPLFWDEGTINTSNTPYTDNKSNILFEARHSIFHLKISGRAMFDKISSFEGKIEGLPIQGGIFDLKTGNYISKDPTYINQLNLSSDDFYTTSNDTVYNLYIYSTHNPPKYTISNVSLTLNEITFPTDAYNKAGKTSRKITTTRTGAPIKITIDPFDITASFGSRYIIIFDLMPPLIAAGTTKFTYNNVYFNEISNAYALRHYNTNIYDHTDFAGLNGSKQEYFNWFTAKPSTISSYNGNFDPCQSVYPYGFYQTPIIQELEQLDSNFSDTQTIPYRYGEYFTEGPSRVATFVSSSGSFLPYNAIYGLQFLQLGYRQESTNSIINKNITNNGDSEAQLWSRTYPLNNLNNAYYLRIHNNANGILNLSRNSGSRIEGRQIRCMRTNVNSYFAYW